TVVNGVAELVVVLVVRAPVHGDVVTVTGRGGQCRVGRSLRSIRDFRDGAWCDVIPRPDEHVDFINLGSDVFREVIDGYAVDARACVAVVKHRPELHVTRGRNVEDRILL